jgi:hypothetical protein
VHCTHGRDVFALERERKLEFQLETRWRPETRCSRVQESSRRTREDGFALQALEFMKKRCTNQAMTETTTPMTAPKASPLTVRSNEISIGVW